MNNPPLMQGSTESTRTCVAIETIGSAAPSPPESQSQGGKCVDLPVEPAHAANAELASRVRNALQATGYTPLRSLSVCAAEGLIILRGVVPSFHLKQLAQAAVRGIAGVSDVRNDLEVVPRPRARDAKREG